LTIKNDGKNFNEKPRQTSMAVDLDDVCQIVAGNFFGAV
jgi:hypothetical protein